MEEDEEYDSKLLGEVKCISRVEVKEEIIYPDNSSDSESTLSDNDGTTNTSSPEECLVCCKYRSMFKLLKNHECIFSEEGCNLCQEISHWSKCFNYHKNSHKEDYSSESTVSDREENEDNCQICLKYEYMIPLLKNHECEADKNCEKCSEFVTWTVHYKNHADTHKDKYNIQTKVKEEDFSDSTISDSEEIQKRIRDSKNKSTECNICFKYDIILIMLKENHVCKVVQTGESCEECNEIRDWYKHFEKHKLSHGNFGSLDILNSRNDTLMSFDCSICLKLNTILRNLVKSHSCSESKSCEVCQEVSYWMSCFKQHKELGMKSDLDDFSDGNDVEGVNVTQNQYNCPVCIKLCSVIQSLKNHPCQKEKNKCEYCRETCFWVKNLKNHEMYHSKEIPTLKKNSSCLDHEKSCSKENILTPHTNFCDSYYTCEGERKSLNIFSSDKHKIFQYCRCTDVQCGCVFCKKDFINSTEDQKPEEIYNSSKLI